MSEYPEYDKDKAAELVRRILGWHGHLDGMPAGERDKLVVDLVRELNRTYGDGRSDGIHYACDRWTASLGGATKEGA